MMARTGLENGNTVTNTITRAVEGLYCARGFNAYDQDYLSTGLGSFSLLYAVSKPLELPPSNAMLP